MFILFSALSLVLRVGTLQMPIIIIKGDKGNLIIGSGGAQYLPKFVHLDLTLHDLHLSSQSVPNHIFFLTDSWLSSAKVIKISCEISFSCLGLWRIQWNPQWQNQGSTCLLRQSVFWCRNGRTGTWWEDHSSSETVHHMAETKHFTYETHYAYHWLLHHGNSLSTFIYSLIPSLPNPCATVITWGWSEYQNMSQHRKLTLEYEKKILPLTPRTRTCDLLITSQVLYHWASPHSLCTIYRYAGANKETKQKEEGKQSSPPVEHSEGIFLWGHDGIWKKQFMNRFISHFDKARSSTRKKFKMKKE